MGSTAGTRIHLFLIGMKHSGKSELGRLLSLRLGTPFFDLDDFISRSAREEGFSSVRDLYRISGKEFFQEHERRAALALAGVLKRETSAPAVAALGGGSVENSEAMRLLTPYGSFLYLKLEEEVLAKRILNGELPPFLRGSEPPERMLRDLLRYRTPLFEQWADFTVDLEDASREENSGRIYRLLKDRRYVG
jgi:shikimate kinase